MNNEQSSTQRGSPKYAMIKPEPDTRPMVLPPARSVPIVIDPYVSGLPQTIEQTTSYVATPITRAQALVTKVSSVTIFLAILTACALVMFDQWAFFGWLFLASLEWVFVFIFLSVLDYREQPSAQHRHEMGCYLDMMAKEQDHRLRYLYPEQYDKKGKRQ